MRKILLPLYFVLSVVAAAQPGKTGRKKGFKYLNRDSLIAKLQKIQDSLSHTTQFDSIQPGENNTNNKEVILPMQKESNTKRNRNAMIYIEVVIILLAMLVIGLRWKAAKKQGS
jgi:hypothetical protein